MGKQGLSPIVHSQSLANLNMTQTALHSVSTSVGGNGHNLADDMVHSRQKSLDECNQLVLNNTINKGPPLSNLDAAVREV